MKLLRALWRAVPISLAILAGIILAGRAETLRGPEPVERAETSVSVEVPPEPVEASAPPEPVEGDR